MSPAESRFPGFANRGSDASDPAGSESAVDATTLIGLLTARRHELELSQTEVAARMGTSQSAIARLEGGGGDVRLSTLERYASAVETNLGFGLHPRREIAGTETTSSADE